MEKNLERKRLEASERYNISKELFRCKMTEGSSVHAHVLKIISLIERQALYGSVMDHGRCVDLILHPLPPCFSIFLVIYRMKEVDTSLPELLQLLTLYEQSLPKEKATHVLLAGGSLKARDKAKKEGLRKLESLGPLVRLARIRRRGKGKKNGHASTVGRMGFGSKIARCNKN